MEAISRGQVSASAAEIYETFFVPALFAAWSPRVADAARIGPGQRVLDVATGTGVLAREALLRVAPGGAVTGVDRNEDMLTVARRIAPAVEWRHSRAEALPFADRAFDAVACQFGLMFFDDRVTALAEMWRVLRPGGRLAVAVWDRIEASPGYAAMAALLERLFGTEVASALHAPFGLGDARELDSLLEAAGIGGARIETTGGSACFPSIEDWVRTDVKGWTLAELIDDDQYRRLLAEAPRALGAFVEPRGTVRFAAPAHVVSATRDSAA